jgi:hypothetical protein
MIERRSAGQSRFQCFALTGTHFFYTLLISLLFLNPGCDTGLAPLNEPSGFSGVIHYSNWPPPDSVRDLRLVAFEKFPSDSSGIIAALLSGKAVIYPPVGPIRLPTFVDAAEYTFSTDGTTLQVKTYEYVVVALQYGSNFLADWKPVGVYTTTPGSFDPAPVRVLLHKITPDININVDFHNPPPKPW